MDENQHPDPTSEAGGRVMEAVAVLASLGEALARAHAEKLRRQAIEQHNNAQQIAADKRRQDSQDRKINDANQRVFRNAHDPKWLERADLLDLAQVWRTAGTHAETDPLAHQAMKNVEGRLRVMYEGPMRLYDDLRAQGKTPDEAMRPAAAMMAHVPPHTHARPHGGRPHAQLENSVAVNSRREPKNAAALASEGFAAPLKPALATIEINPELVTEPTRRKKVQTTATTRGHR